MHVTVYQVINVEVMVLEIRQTYFNRLMGVENFGLTVCRKDVVYWLVKVVQVIVLNEVPVGSW